MTIVHEESFGIIPLRQKNDGDWEVFLILHRKGHHWGFPKGHKAHEAELSFDAAKRELFEETSLSVETLLYPDPLQERYEFYRSGSLIHKCVFYFIACVQGTPVLQPEEIQQGKWIALDQAYQILTFQQAHHLCSQVLSLLKH